MPSVSKRAPESVSSRNMTGFGLTMPRNQQNTDGAGEFLRHIHRSVNAPTDDWMKHGEFFAVSQKKYQLAEKHGLDDVLFMYVPNICIKSSGCKVVFMLHGCV